MAMALSKSIFDMKIITERDIIRSVADRWADTYETGYYANDPEKQGILKSLRMLSTTTCSVDDVNKIIGNKSWTRMRCNECTQFTNWVIQLGEEPDYESATASLCRPCFDKAVQLVTTQSSTP